MPPDPPSFWVCFAHLHHQKGPLFLEKNLPTLSSSYGPGYETIGISIVGYRYGHQHALSHAHLHDRVGTFAK